MAKGRKSIKKKVVIVPKDRVELGKFVSNIQEIERKIIALEDEFGQEIAEMAAKISKLKKEAQGKAKPYEERINELAKGVYIFAEGRRAELTDQGARKTVELAAGNRIRWYFTPPAVEVDEEEEALKELERRGLLEFIRVKREIDKEAILREPEKIKNLKHLSVGQEEIFAIVLSAMGIELQKGERKFKKIAA